MDMLSRELDIEFREEIYRLKFGVVKHIPGVNGLEEVT